MRFLLFVTGLAPLAAYFPSAMKDFNTLHTRQLSSQCGVSPCLIFNAKDQYVDATPGSTHQYVALGPMDKRGPCPGLNSAANHGFLPHNGIPTVTQTITGFGQAFGMSTDLASFLAAYAVSFNGDPGTQTWSIGGPYPGSLLGSLLGSPEGIFYSHNNYESDSSVTRNDAFLNKGDAYSLNRDSFKRLLSNKNAQGLYTIDSLQSQAIESRRFSIENNSYFISSPFAGVAVAPVAHYFIVRMTSNHSAKNPEGYLDESMLKTHFGVTGGGDNLAWTPGTERIPNNWYRRPRTSPYSIPAALPDIVAGILKYPELGVVGGNLGKPNTFTSVDISNLTGGVYNSQKILQGNNLGCFIFQSIQIVMPDMLTKLFSNIAPTLNLLNGVLTPIIGSFGNVVINLFSHQTSDPTPPRDAQQGDLGLFQGLPINYYPEISICEVIPIASAIGDILGTL